MVRDRVIGLAKFWDQRGEKEKGLWDGEGLGSRTDTDLGALGLSAGLSNENVGVCSQRETSHGQVKHSAVFFPRLSSENPYF